MKRRNHRYAERILTLLLAGALGAGQVPAVAFATASAVSAASTDGIDQLTMRARSNSTFALHLQGAKNVTAVEFDLRIRADQASDITIFPENGFVSVSPTVISQDNGMITIKVTFTREDGTPYTGNGTLAVISSSKPRATAQLLGVSAVCGYTATAIDIENYTNKILSLNYDVSGDGRVDLTDLNRVSQYYGVSSTSAVWATAQMFDFNGDHKIGIQDLAEIKLNYGRLSNPDIPTVTPPSASDALASGTAYRVEANHFYALELHAGDLDDYAFTVNGNPVAVTPINDEKTLVKFAYNPQEDIDLRVTANNKTQNLSVASGTEPFTQAVQVPETILTSGPVSTFEYHLPPYDANGKVRVQPLKSTFATTESPAITANDIKLWVKPKSPADTDVVIKYNEVAGKTDAWQNAITGIYVDFGSSASSRVPVSYSLGINGSYGDKTVRHIVLDTTSHDSYFNGRNTAHTVLIQATGYDDTRIRFETVLPNHGMNLSPNYSYLAEDTLLFSFNDAISFPNNQVQAVYLDDTLLFDCIDDSADHQDYHVVGNQLTLNCMETDRMNALLGVGEHTLRVEVMGMETYEKNFTLREAYHGEKNPSPYNHTDNPTTQAPKTSKTISYDAMTVATGGVSVGSGDSSSGGGGMMRANLIWDFDLLVNAKLLQFMDKATALSQSITATYGDGTGGWWESQTKDAIIVNDGNNILLDYATYKETVGQAHGTDTYYTFDEYYADILADVAENPNHDDILPTTPKVDGVYYNRPYSVKHMLETAQMGDIVYYWGNVVNADAPALTIDTARISPTDTLVLHYAGDSDWARNITSIMPNSFQHFTYTLDESAKTISISGTANSFPVGAMTLTITADGYKQATATVTVNQLMQGDVAMTQNDAGDVEVSIPDADFRNGLNNISLSTKKNLLSDDATGGDGDYAMTGDTLTLKFAKLFANQENDEQITLTLQAHGYADVTIPFVYSNLDKSTPDTVLPTTPPATALPESLSLKNGITSYGGFTATVSSNDQLKIFVDDDAYENSITAITLENSEGNMQLSGKSNFFGGYEIYLYSQSYGANHLKSGANTVTIVADGYPNAVFTITVT